MSAGRRRAERVAGGRPVARLLLAALTLLLPAAAWVVLVAAAIRFGRSARATGDARGWLFTIAASGGAALCLTLVFVLVVRARHAVRARPRHQPGRHR